MTNSPTCLRATEKSKGSYEISLVESRRLGFACPPSLYTSTLPSRDPPRLALCCFNQGVEGPPPPVCPGLSIHSSSLLPSFLLVFASRLLATDREIFPHEQLTGLKRKKADQASCCGIRKGQEGREGGRGGVGVSFSSHFHGRLQGEVHFKI